MERTPRLLRITLASLPRVPDATIILPEVEAGGAVDDEQHSAEFHAATANDSSPTERELEAGGAVDDDQYGSEFHAAAANDRSPTERGLETGGAIYDEQHGAEFHAAAANDSSRTERVLSGQVHHVEAGAGRRDMHTISQHQELSVPAASDHAAPKNNLVAAAVEKNGCTDRGLLHHRIPGEGRHDTYNVAEHPDLTAPAASERAGTTENITAFDAEEGLGGHPGSHTSICYTRYEQNMDLYLYGRPVSEFWKNLWVGVPLILHDRELLSARKYIAGCRKTEFGFDLMSEISSVLDSHPGPISYFRVDSSSWAPEKLERWLEILSAHTVQKVTVVNNFLPTTTIFPITKLQGPGLTALCVAFMDIPGLSFGAFDYCSLDTLQLTGCTYCSKGLESVVVDCPGLRSLVLGCSHEDICITSQSLMSIQIWNCTASFLRIDYAPKLLTLSMGIRPRVGLQSVMLSVNTVEALAEIRYIMLPFHDLTIRAASIIEGEVALPRVRRVGLGIQMGSSHQRGRLVSMLKHMPRLTHLILLIVEDCPTDDQEYDASTSTIESLSCVRASLQSLVVEGFRGGRAEVAMIADILNKAGKLAEVVLEPHLFDRPTIEAAKKVERCPRASIGCCFSVRHPD